MSQSVRGNPEMDVAIKKIISHAIEELRLNAKYLNAKTLSDISSDLHTGLAITENIRASGRHSALLWSVASAGRLSFLLGDSMIGNG